MSWLIIIAIILIYYVLTVNSYYYEEYIYGMWEGDVNFCKQSGVEYIRLFIGEADGLYSIKRNAYLIIDNACNQHIIINYKKPWFNINAPSRLPKYEFVASVEFAEEDLWPNEITFEFDILNGCLRIHDGETCYCKLYKDNEITNMANMLDKKQQNDEV